MAAFGLVVGLGLPAVAQASTELPDDERTNTDDEVVTEGGQGAQLGNGLGTSGTVTSAGTGIAPSIECKWEALDMDSTSNTSTAYSLDGEFDDDDAMVPTPYNPCDLVDGSLSYASGARNSIQVLPNAHDLPNERTVELWGAVSHEQGLPRIGDVYWDVYEWCNVRAEGDFATGTGPHINPIGTGYFDGTASGWCLKTQVHAPSQTSSPSDITVATPEVCSSLGHLNADMLQAANETGQLSSAAIGNSSASGSLLERCFNGSLGIYTSSFTISKEQPCGEYMVEMHAVSSGQAAQPLVNYIDVICFHQFEFDQDQITWDQINSGSTTYVHGDFAFIQNDGAPTVRNTGNSGLSVGVRFSKMTSLQNPLKPITHFDACFGTSSSPGEGYQCQDPIFATENTLAGDDGTLGPLTTPFFYFEGIVGTDFDPARNGLDEHPGDSPHWPRGTVVCQNQTAKLTLSLHAPAALQVLHQYAGEFEIVAYNSARWGPGDPTVSTDNAALSPRDPAALDNLGRCWSDNADYLDGLPA